jgi:two-component system response regulator AtoC
LTLTYKKSFAVANSDFEQVGDGLFFIAASPAARKLRTQAVLLAQVDVPVLISGEKGSGKTVAAQFIHKLSARAAGKFIKVHCSESTRDLLDIELFGSEENTIDGGVKVQPGKLELCENGTLLLDEISDLPTELQFKLLRVLQDKQFLRVGGEKPVHADVRILGTISVEISNALASRKLHEDLYNRLSAFTLQVPALRERSEETSLLMDYFMHELSRFYSLPPRSFSAEMLSVCRTYTWPGNLRQLKSYIKRYLVIGDEELAIAELQRGETFNDTRVSEADRSSTAHTGNGLKSLVQTVKGEAERTAIAAALDQTRWNRKAAAVLLRVSYRTLLYKIDQYHMSPPEPPIAYVEGSSSRGHGR